MLKGLIFTTLCIFFLFTVNGQNFVEVNKSNTGQSVQISQNQVLEINLPRMSSTGYIWCESNSYIDNTTPQSIIQVGDGDFIPAQSTLKGRTGTQILRYVGASEGTTVLTLELRRTWERNLPASDNFTITVVSAGKYNGTYAPSVKENPKHMTSTTKSVPSRWDWRSQCTPITDQMQCGDCWAFAGVGTLECNIKIHDGVTRDISEEYVTDCYTGNGCSGCNGGNCPHAVWLAPLGAVYETEDPWTTSEANGNTGTCGSPYVYHETIDSYSDVVGQTSGNNYIPADADMKAAIYNYGPIWVGIDASSTAWNNYSGGIWTEAASNTYSDHAVCLVGWVDSTGITGGGYWILRNSWGTGWGDHGYMYITYGSDIVGQNADYIVYKGGVPHSVPPVTSFSASNTSSCTGTIQFTDNSSNLPSTWHWDFGDGDTSNVENPTHTYIANGTYTVSLIATNTFGVDSLIKTNYITVNMPPAPSLTNSSFCGSGSYTFTATGNGPFYWYNAATGGTLLGSGSNYTTPNLTTNATYYVEQDVVPTPQYVGKSDSTGGGSNYTQTSNYLIFTCYSPVTLASVLVYASVSGNRTIELRNNTGTLIQSATVNIPAGQGRINLNLNVPAGTGLELRLASGTTSNLWRSSGGITYPYTISNKISITGSTATTTLRYYFFYDWEVLDPACSSARSAASVEIAPVAGFTYSSANNNLNFSNTSLNGTTYLWNFGDGSTSAQMNPSHVYQYQGSYTVSLIVSNSCGTDSTSEEIDVISGIENIAQTNGIEIFPNPNNGNFEVKIISENQANMQINILNIEGKKIYSDFFHVSGRETMKNYNLAGFEKGIYQVQLISGSKITDKLIVIQ